MPDEVASLITLPHELYEYILRWLNVDDYKRLRLACKTLCLVSTPSLFGQVRLSLNPESWVRANQISSHEALRSHARELVLSSKLLPQFPSQQAWAQCIDIRPFVGQYWSERSKETGERIFEELNGGGPKRWFVDAYDKLQKLPWELDLEYANYQEAASAQRRLVFSASFAKDFAVLLASFPRLSTLEVEPWYAGWWETQTTRMHDIFSPYDKFHHWLKPKSSTIFKRAEPIWQDWFQSEMFRSSILEDRTIGTSLVLQAVNLQSDELRFTNLRTLNLHLSFEGCEAEPNFVEGGADTSNLGDRSDERLYEDAAERIVRSLEQARIPLITNLVLTIQGEDCRQPTAVALEMASRLLSTATSLTELTLELIPPSPYAVDEDYLEYFRAVCMPNLRKLTILNMAPSEDSLCDFLNIQASTLNTLVMKGVILFDGTWSSLVKNLLKVLSLDKFLIDNDVVYDSYANNAHCSVSEYDERSWPGSTLEDSPELTNVNPDLGWG